MKVITRILLIIGGLALLYLLGPRPVKPLYAVLLPNVPSLAELTSFVHLNESKHRLKPGNEAEIIWQNASQPAQTEYAVVYLHGFSASKEEGNPVHRYLADSLRANLYLARLADHGIDTIAPMQYFTADRIWESAKQAYAIGKKLGKKVILVGTSTGGTLALQLAATYPDIHSLVLLSPNIAINDDKAWVVNNPWGLQIARLVTGDNERILKGKNEAYQKFWYINYRLESVVQLQELLETSMKKSLFERVKQPVLMLYYYKSETEQDPVVRVDAMLKMFDELGTPAAEKQKMALPSTGNHVIGSSITSKDIESVKRAMQSFIIQRKKEISSQR